MISVVITNAGRRRALEMQGHAGFSQKGEPDIVCAGCSAVVYALLGWMENHPERFRTEGPARISSGEVFLCASGGADFQAAFETAEIGLMQIERKYPGNVKIRLRKKLEFS